MRIVQVFDLEVRDHVIGVFQGLMEVDQFEPGGPAGFFIVIEIFFPGLEIADLVANDECLHGGSPLRWRVSAFMNEGL